ncbi:MAG: hypothetical protein LKF87_10130 [Clostridium tyrobutyricum]|jgi:hypothetical protein|uniref:hypothetical protein n=1 Tax=Clostridium tyrobutyricum TaxID=1519 RepID=UPI00242A3BDD|nr:hypothetical protein [Clostridium tyrobutyricum]MCH4201247.1 hypothetical protein [Clostridium tyrobutyricum]MCH4237524.1 hypothetical protein [Clostridium tyrobutyricum]MCH4259307.1 hypothetical protein [Clostridium tyrobutyricum]
MFWKYTDYIQQEQADSINVYTRQGFEFTVKQNQIIQCTGNSKIFVYKIHRDVVGLDVFGKLRIFLVNKFGSTAYIATEYKITN